MNLSDNDSDATVLDEEEEARGQRETVPSITERQDELGISSPTFPTMTVSTNSPAISQKLSNACTNSSSNSLQCRHFTTFQPTCINLLGSGGQDKTQSEAPITSKNDPTPCHHHDHQTQQTLNNTLEAVPINNISQIEPHTRSDVNMQVNEQVMESPGAPIDSTVSSPSLLHTSLQSLLERRSLSESSCEKGSRPNVMDTSVGGGKLVASAREEVQFK